MRAIDNNSFKFINKRMLEQRHSTEGLNEAIIFPIQQRFCPDNANILAKGTFHFDYNNSDIEIIVECADKEFSNFDFYATHAEHNDGTLAFVTGGIAELLDKMFYLQSVPTNKLSKLEDIDGVKTIRILVGDAVVLQTTDRSPDNSKPYLTNKLEIYLPAYFELIKE